MSRSRLVRTALLLAAVTVLAGCAAGARAAPDWRPQPSFSGDGPDRTLVPALPAPGRDARGGPHGGGTSPSHAPSSPSSTQPADPAVVAAHLAAPVGLTLLPDGTALVGERTTGRIVDVQPQPGMPVRTVRTLTGLDAGGDGGLLDLALSPNYFQDSLIFAYVTTPTDNRVITFTLTGPATPVITGIPKGGTGNAGRIAFGADGDLYVATGDAGDPALAADPNSLAGKVLRITDIGTPAPGNPDPASPVFASGSPGMAGLCADASTVVAVSADRVDLVLAGASYGWPAAEPGDSAAIGTLPAGRRAAGGCALMGGSLYVTSLDGRALLAATFGRDGTAVKLGDFQATLVNRYGRLRTVVAAPDGALWLTTSNTDGRGTPAPDDERVLRIVPSGGAGTNPA
ncbi:MAG: oxidoreductase [Jatrophihabitans sp.]|nr:MAG: oxidoreductase [Jatrophihabitans sp.]